MSTTHARGKSPTDSRSTDQTNNDDEVTHAKECAPTEREFEYLVEATYDMERYYGLQCRLILFLGGRLGMRAGEIAHLSAEWIDWENGQIVIPAYHECTDGREREICGYCWQKSDQMARVRTENAYEQLHENLQPFHELEPGRGGAAECVVETEEMAETRWQPKTDSAARDVPFEPLTRATIHVERFFDRFDAWPHTRQSINRRVDRMLEHCPEVDECTPHALRASAAEYWAAREMQADEFQSLMGWADGSTSRTYIRESGARVANAMRRANR